MIQCPAIASTARFNDCLAGVATAGYRSKPPRNRFIIRRDTFIPLRRTARTRHERNTADETSHLGTGFSDSQLIDTITVSKLHKPATIFELIEAAIGH